MEIIITTRSDEHLSNYDYRNFYDICIDGKRVFYVHDGEPEDSNLSRDFNDVYKLPEILEMVYNAGLSGESFDIEFKEEEY